MTTSGVADFNLDLNEIIEEAFDRAGLEVRTGYEWRTARRSLNLMLADWANRGFNMWTVEQGSIPLVQGQYVYDLPDDTVDLCEHVIRTSPGQQANQQDLTITRISVSTYATIPNKLNQARPIQIYVDRQAETPNVKLWPVPNQGTEESPYYTLVYWRLRRMYNAGTGVNTQDIPFRFLSPMTAGSGTLCATSAVRRRSISHVKSVFQRQAQYRRVRYLWLSLQAERAQDAGH